MSQPSFTLTLRASSMFSVAMLVAVSPILTPCVKKGQPDSVPGPRGRRNPRRSLEGEEPQLCLAPCFIYLGGKLGTGFVKVGRLSDKRPAD